MATSLSRSSLSISNQPFSYGFQFIDRLLYTPSSWCQSSWSSKGLSRAVSATVHRCGQSVTVDNSKIKDPIIVIDNYDSTYNLCQYVGELGCTFDVYRSDEISVNELKRKNPRGIVISPGPERGISLQTVLELGPSVPLFGVCMGLQCIGDAFGGKIVPLPSGAVRGKSSLIYHDEKGHDGLFTGLSNPFAAGRYHCFVIEKESYEAQVFNFILKAF